MFPYESTRGLEVRPGVFKLEYVVLYQRIGAYILIVTLELLIDQHMVSPGTDVGENADILVLAIFYR